MTKWIVELSDKARKRLGMIQEPERTRIWTAIKKLANGTKQKGLDVKRLHGRPDWRLRVGDWRVIFKISREIITIMVMSIDTRGDAYK